MGPKDEPATIRFEHRPYLKESKETCIHDAIFVCYEMFHRHLVIGMYTKVNVGY